MIKRITFLLFIFLFLSSANSQDITPKRINVGYFEAGKYPVHSLLREEYFNQLEQILPEEFAIVTVPEGFRSADWKRDDCRRMAEELARIKHLDMIIAVGPWVVQDLLDAGCKIPILGIHQFNPYMEGLLDNNAVPIAENLTITQSNERISSDLTIFKKLVNIRKLGLLYFPSADEKEKIYDHFRALGNSLNFELVIGEGDDNYGTFAFFKAFNNLSDRVDALYLPPMWGMDQIKISEFFNMLKIKRIPTFTYEGNLLVDKGAFATNDYYGIISEARFNAEKTVAILEGATPSSLPVLLEPSQGLAVNLQTAEACKIEIPEDVVNNFHTIDPIPHEDIDYYSLNDALSRAVSHNPGYLAQYEALNAAASEASRAWSDYLPHIYGSADYLKINNNRLDLTEFDDVQLYSSLNLEQTLLSLSSLKEIKIAAKNRDLENINLNRSQLDLELGVAAAYLEYTKQLQILQVFKSYRKLNESNIELARAKHLYSRGDTLDVINFENERYRINLRIIETRNKLKISKVVLNSLFNLPGDLPFVLDTGLFSDKHFALDEYPLLDKIKTESDKRRFSEKILNHALTYNPDITRYDLTIGIQKDLLSLNKTRYFPEIGFRTSFDYEDNLRNPLSQEADKTSWTVGTFLKWPLFSGGDRYKEKSQLKARLSEAEYLKDNISLNLMEKTMTEVDNLLSKAYKMTPLFQNKTRAANALRISLPRFINDNIDALDIIHFQQEAMNTEIEFIDNRIDYYLSMAKLVNLSGITSSDKMSQFIEEFHKLAEY